MLGVLELLIVILIGPFFFFLILKALTNKTEPGRSDHSIDESRMIQEMHQGFIKMDERIDALETLLLERTEQRVNEHKTV